MLSSEEKKIICDFFDLIFKKSREIGLSLNDQKEVEVESNSQPQKRLIPLTKWGQFHNWPTVGGLRALVFNSHNNGFDRCMRRVGRRILIDEESFFDWINNPEKRTVSKSDFTSKNTPSSTKPRSRFRSY